MEIKFLQEVEENRKFHYWYGGAVAKIVLNEEVSFVIYAMGDVIGSIYRNKDKEEVVSFKDKNNNGVFYEAVSPYIKNDEELKEVLTTDYITDEYFEENKDKQYTVYLDNNNWWEVQPVIKGKHHDIMWNLDADTIDEAIEETKAGIDRVLKDLKQENK